MIDDYLLLEKGGIVKVYDKDEMIFSEGASAQYFYQVKHGLVKMMSDNEEVGKDFIQGFFQRGQSFGEPPLFDELPYPASAFSAAAKTEVIRLRKDVFLEIIKGDHDLHFQLTALIAKRLRFKSMMLREIACYPPQHRIITLFDYLKNAKLHQADEKFKVPFSRKEIANQTGLRVETVIRTILTMAEEGLLEIKSGKVYY